MANNSQPPRLAEIFAVDQTPTDLNALREASPHTVYAIIFTARSGSTFLTHTLSNTGRFGTPHEWFNPETVQRLVNTNSISSLQGYIRFLWKTYVSQNGVFGLEINWPQLTALLDLVDFNACFRQQIVWFYLRRRNLVAQSVSLFKANATSVFHSYQIDAEKGEAPSTAYDGPAIAECFNMLLMEEIAIERFCIDSGIRPVELFYEDISSEPPVVLTTFSNVLRVRRNAIGCDRPNAIRKIGDWQNEVFEARFRQEYADLLAEKRETRPRLLLPHSTV